MTSFTPARFAAKKLFKYIREVAKSTGAGVTVDWADESALRAFLETAWRQFRSGGVPAPTGEIGPYSRRATTHALAALLNREQKQAETLPEPKK